ncbi:hypothetical protein DKX38_008067 [Salix brachista]|uniref:Uncharacterized protein n=1 Tax=Salix brachista TaxID=2182728 RepID=A0A5N5MQE8_9ROSI|nr:hypothetical protein DKX38_008067 [Salix brachista]
MAETKRSTGTVKWFSAQKPVEFSVDSGEDGSTKAYDVIGVSRSCRLLVASAEEVAGEGTTKEEGVVLDEAAALAVEDMAALEVVVFVLIADRLVI